MSFHSPEEEKHNPFINNPDFHVVPVLASFSTEGKMVPIYFSIEGLKIKIERVVWTCDNLAWGSQYRCQIHVNNKVEEIDLLYYKNRNLWTVKQMK